MHISATKLSHGEPECRLQRFHEPSGKYRHRWVFFPVLQRVEVACGSFQIQVVINRVHHLESAFLAYFQLQVPKYTVRHQHFEEFLNALEILRPANLF